MARFDWAMKRLLRQKANFVVLESFLSELFGERVKIRNILESEGDKESEDDKFNRVDLFAVNDKDELLLVEIQNTSELYYFQRMLYGTSKAITDYIYEGDKYSEVCTSTWGRVTTTSTMGSRCSRASTRATRSGCR